MAQFPYRFFDQYVVRTPIFSYQHFLRLAHEDEITDGQVQKLGNDRLFMEALYLASPDVYEKVRKWLNSKNEEPSKEFQKLKETLIKYYSRMGTRCTPFGLFSGVGLGTFNDGITNNRPDVEKVRDTKLDMHFLVALAHHFVATPEIRNQLLFYPNNSMYVLGDKIRYIEYEYTEGKRDYVISSALISHELQQVLALSTDGKTKEELCTALINEDITEKDAEVFIEELIDHQVLVSELEPNVSGNDFLDTLLSVMGRIDAGAESKYLMGLKSKLKVLDQSFGNSVALYADIEEYMNTFKIAYQQKYLFQTDLYYDHEFSLSPHWKKEIKKGVSILNKLTLPQKDTRFSRFKKAFAERYESREVPLSQALDVEVGIGYQQDFYGQGIHPYLEDLEVSGSHENKHVKLELNPIHQLLNRKVQQALWENKTVMEISAEDFKDFDENWSDVPETLSFMAELISETHEEKLILKGLGGGSAANLLGRFCAEKSTVKNLAQSITKKEEELRHAQHGSHEILAEVIHLPEARIGNIIRRPTLRNYEIPYLAQSVLPKDHQISSDDLYISLRNNRIILRSKKLNKEVKPYLTNAHNYSKNSLPVYHFLSDFYSQDRRSGLHFNWGGLKHIYAFLPRVEYENIILSKARWNIYEEDIMSLVGVLEDKTTFLSELEQWRIQRKIPAWIQWVQYDNTLTLNLENYDLAKLFIDTVKKMKSIIIEEFLYNEHDDFKRELIFPMYKE